MKTILYLILAMSIFFLLIGCRNGDNEKVFSLYRNDFQKETTLEPEAGITAFIVKVTNPHSSIMLVPFSVYHQINDVLLAYGRLETGNKIMIDCYGSPNMALLGYDTLYPMETQRYFTSIEISRPERSPIEVVCFEYYLIDDLLSKAHMECFFIFENEANELMILDARKDFFPCRDSIYYIE